MHVACNSHALVFLGVDRGLAALARPMLIAATGVHDGSASTSVVGCVYAAMCCFCIVDCIGADEPSRSGGIAWGCGPLPSSLASAVPQRGPASGWSVAQARSLRIELPSWHEELHLRGVVA